MGHAVYAVSRSRAAVLALALLLLSAGVPTGAAAAGPILTLTGDTAAYTYNSTARIEGSTLPNATVLIAGTTVKAGADGTFGGEVDLDVGVNRITILVQHPQLADETSVVVTIVRLPMPQGPELSIDLVMLLVIGALAGGAIGGYLLGRRKGRGGAATTAEVTSALAAGPQVPSKRASKDGAAEPGQD